VKGSQDIYIIRQAASAIFMILALLWLTVSTPFVYAADQSIKMEKQEVEEDNGGPLSGSTEEKNESSVNTLSEYLHDYHQLEHGFTPLAKYFKCHPSDLYFAYHPELISPPPEA
jgi:hypothetical protein